MSLASKIILGRLLTRSGDQAWDFAVPIVLLTILPGQLKFASLYYLFVRFAHVLILPSFASKIDRVSRSKSALWGISMQLAGVIAGTIAVYWLYSDNSSNLAFLFLTLAGLVSGLGASFMDIAVANDLVPSAFSGSELPKFNSRLRQCDLLTEVTAPILAGLLLLLKSDSFPLFGFFLIAIWNLISFGPEYALLTSIFKERPDLQTKDVKVDPNAKLSLLKKFMDGWSSFSKQPVALATTAYAILWLSALSPHGVLLTAFLKDGWTMPEWMIGTFRGLGAFFGLAATLIFPKVISKVGLEKGSLLFLAFQFGCVAFALMFFLFATPNAQIGFLGFVLLSRIGLYGFSLGEVQLRQILVPSAVRGEINGFASALTGIATLGLYGAGSLLPATEDFWLLVMGSTASVGLALLTFSFWRSRLPEKHLQS